MTEEADAGRTLNVGMVGLGAHCRRTLLPTTKFLPVKLRAFCDVDEENLAVARDRYAVEATYTEAADMYAEQDLDAVFIAVSPMLHAELACQALDAGVHVWVEKPPAMSAGEIEDMIEHRGDLVGMVGFKKAFMPAIYKVREVLSAEGSGALMTVLGEYAVRLPQNGAAVLEERQGNDWLANGVHPVSAMMSVGGRVTAVTMHRGPWGGGVCVMEFGNGAVGNLHLAQGMEGPCERYSFFARGAHLVVDNARKVIWHRHTPFRYHTSTSFAPEGTGHGSVVWEAGHTFASMENKALFIQGFYGEMRHFCHCVLEGRQPELGGLEFALNVMQVYEAGLRSQGGRVEIG